MISSILRSARQALTLIRTRFSLLGPILVMVFVEYFADRMQELLSIGELSPWQLWQRVVFGQWRLLLFVLAVAVLVKSAFLLFSNEDISLGFQGEGVARYRKILTTRPVWYYLLNAGFTAAWYVAFFALATALIVVSTAIGDEAWEWLFVMTGFVLLWPIYYAGVSVAAFLIAMCKHQLIAPGSWRGFLRQHYGKLYVFFAIRSAVELVVLVGGPAYLILNVEAPRIRDGAILLLVAVFTLFTRSASVAFAKMIYEARR